jgi:hypothetical protein
MTEAIILIPFTLGAVLLFLYSFSSFYKKVKKTELQKLENFNYKDIILENDKKIINQRNYNYFKSLKNSNCCYSKTKGFTIKI